MLEGLEIAEEYLSVMLKKERLDSNYAAFPNRNVLKRILETQNWKTLGEVVNYISSGHTPYLYDVKSEGDIGFITVECISDLKLHFDRLKSITKEHFENEFKNNRLVKDSVCCTIKRRICKAFPVTKDFGDLAFNQDISFFLPKTEIVNPVYLATYLCSNIGQSFAFRQMTEQMNPYISVGNLKSLPIVILSMSFQKKIAALFEVAQQLSENSTQSYSSAETILLETIGLKDFEPSTDAVNVKSYKDSFLTSGRLDSEYYQKKYEEVVSHIKAQKYDMLSNLVTIKKSIEPGSDAYSDEGLPFMRVSDFNKLGLSEPDKKLSSAFCSDNATLIKKFKPKKETILFSKDGSVGTAYMLRKDEDLITSGAILHLTVKDKSQIIPEYLTLALNSKLVQMQAERDAGGSIILHWRISEIENVVVPIIDYTKQEEIAKLVEESFRLKKQSEQLLETAKRAVELAIEQDEEAAMLYILQNVISQVKPKLVLQILISDQLTDLEMQDVTDDFIAGEVLPIYTVQETKPFMCLEWAIPTAIVVVLGQFASGFFGEMGKDAYVALKNGIKKLAKKARPINARLVGTKPIDESNTQSKSFSIETITKDKTHIKFLFDNEGSMDDWEMWIDKATGLLEENYLQDDSEMQRKLDAMEKPISTPVFWVYKKETDSWEPHDLKKVARSQYEKHRKNPPEN